MLSIPLVKALLEEDEPFSKARYHMNAPLTPMRILLDVFEL